MYGDERDRYPMRSRSQVESGEVRGRKVHGVEKIYTLRGVKLRWGLERGKYQMKNEYGDNERDLYPFRNEEK